MLRPVRTEKIIREINGAEFPKSEFCCGYENLVFVEIDGLGVIEILIPEAECEREEATTSQ